MIMFVCVLFFVKIIKSKIEGEMIDLELTDT